jgi:hypothetical protein
MNAMQARADVFFTAFNTLPRREKKAIVEKIMHDPEFREDLIDVAIAEQRIHEPSRNIDDYLKDRHPRAGHVRR